MLLVVDKYFPCFKRKIAERVQRTGGVLNTSTLNANGTHGNAELFCFAIAVAVGEREQVTQGTQATGVNPDSRHHGQGEWVIAWQRA